MASSNITSFVAPFLKMDLPLNFYNVPKDALAVLSTHYKSRPLRQLPDPPSPPIIRSDGKAEIQRKALSLRREFPKIVREIKTPTHWIELYNYFDGVDLWLEGAPFLFYVLNYIGNENLVLDHELDQAKAVELRKWAQQWVASNTKRVMSIPVSQDLVSIFDVTDKESFDVLTQNQMLVMRDALNYHRHLLNQSLAQTIESTLHATSQSFHSVPTVAQPYQRMQQRQPIQSYPMIGPTDPYRNQAMANKPDRNVASYAIVDQFSVQPIHPPPQSYNYFMENQRQIASYNPTPTGDPSEVRSDSSGHWERQPRGYANEMARHGRGPRGNAQYANFDHQNRSNFPANERLIASKDITPRRSPQRRASLANQITESPIYVHNNPHRRSPSSGWNKVSKYSDRNLVQKAPRIFSDPMTGRRGYSNDARVWESLEKQGETAISQDVAKIQKAPFQGHPQARILMNSRWPSSTFWYVGGPGNSPFNIQSTRTLYVSGAEQDDFTSHKLKDLVSKFGEVESISYLFASQNGGGPAFIQFMDESALEPAIRALNGWEMPSGRKLTVNVPNSRPISGSQSSYKGFESNHHPKFPGSRDFQTRTNTRRGSFMNQSASYRPSNRPNGNSSPTRTTPNSPNQESPSRNTLTAGFQAQLMPGQLIVMQSVTEPLLASITEVLQHQAAINRLSPQTPLNSLDNSSNTNKLSCSRSHSRKLSGNFDNGDQPHNGKSQAGSNNKKENSPIKTSKRGPPLTPSKNGSSILQSEENSQKPYTGKNKSRGVKQILSARPSPTASPAKSRLEENLIKALKREQYSKDGSLGVDAQEAEIQIANCNSVQSKSQIEDRQEREESKPKKRSKQKKRKSTQRSDAENSSFDVPLVCDDSSDVVESTSNMTKSTNTSFTYSSGRQPSPAFEPSYSGLSTVDASQHEKLDSDTSFSSSVQEVINIPEYPVVNHRKANSNLSSDSTPDPPSATGKSREKQRCLSHYKKYSNGSTISNGSARKADLKAANQGDANPNVQNSVVKSGNPDEKDVGDGSARPSAGSHSSRGAQKENQQPSSIVLDDPIQWPALGPATTPHFIIADGKHPQIAAIRPLIERLSSNKNSNVPIIPAVPLNMQRRRQSIDSKAWPYVKKCTSK